MKSLFCIAANGEQAHAIVETLKASGLRDEQVSIVIMENSQISANAEQPVYDSQSAAGTTVGGVAGAGAGAALGWAVALGATPILGPLAAAGPLLTILAGAAVGGTTGSAIGAIVGAGLPAHRAKHYETKLGAGEVIVAAHPRSLAQAKTVHTVFEIHHVQEVDEADLKLDIAASE